jgi:hypothetical protein
MKEEVRLLLGLLIFYLAYIFLVDSTRLANIPLLIILGIFLFYLFIPDLSNENNIVNKNKRNLILLLFLGAVFIFILINTLLLPLILIGFCFILLFLTASPGIYKSLTTGIYLSAPLFLLGPFYFLFAFLGFFTFWIARKI